MYYIWPFPIFLATLVPATSSLTQIWQQPLHWLPMFKLAISFPPLFFFLLLTQQLEWSFKNVASCSKSLCVWLISEQRSYLIPQALFLLSSDPFQVPSQQHNFLHSSLYLSAFRKTLRHQIALTSHWERLSKSPS